MTRFSCPLVLLAASLGSASVGCSAEGLPPEEVGQSELEVNAASGPFLFKHETFQGNGRTCETCHSKKTGTVSPADALQRLFHGPADPLFLHDGSDDGAGNGTSRMTQHATIRVEIQLPPNVTIADDPQARSVTLLRGIPTTINTPALDTVLMLDGRAPNLETQADNAIHDHAQPGREPTAQELAQIADFEREDPGFFSSTTLRKFAQGKGPAPLLPPGQTESEKHGRVQFLPDGLCGGCHGGPMLNTTTPQLEAILDSLGFVLPAGTRFQDVLVSDRNRLDNPVREFLFEEPGGSITVVKSSDPGRALITGHAKDEHGFVLMNNANQFKISSLWGVQATAPYFHDNSADTLEDVVDHYADFVFVGMLNEQDKADIVAYLKLL